MYLTCLKRLQIVQLNKIKYITKVQNTMFKRSTLLCVLLLFGSAQLRTIANPFKSELAQAALQISGGICTGVGGTILTLGEKTTFWDLLTGINKSTSNGLGLTATGVALLIASNPSNPSTPLDVAGKAIKNMASIHLASLLPYAKAFIGYGNRTEYPLKTGFVYALKIGALYLSGTALSSLHSSCN